MQPMDLNLLVALEALLAEGGVTGAAARLNKSVPAMSRTLDRLRKALDDPLFVRAGRDFVPTTRALALRPRLGSLIAEAEAMLRPEAFDPLRLERRFVIRCGDDLASALGPLLSRSLGEAPGVSIVLAPEGEESVADLRDGRVDVDIGAPGVLGPEALTQTLLRDRFVGAGRAEAAIFAGPIDAARYAAAEHVSASRRGLARGPIDRALSSLGLERRVRLIVASSGAALAAARSSDLIASVPRLVARAAVARGMELRLFDLPVTTPELTVAASWHPRQHADPAHRWLRERLRFAVASLGFED
ncbi:MAG TPA: LysR family transcriptional regulator [Methylosinus sp.]|uniref:LysR family transcriptional regulator n=1 Tax=Methylosinus sp. TaxID=427 RepID=UPI002F93C76C